MPRKKIQIVKNKSGYLKIGHDVWCRDDYNKKKPNYMWGFAKGKMHKRAETPECRGHGYVDEWREIDWDFCGRYDAKKRVISCAIHLDSIISFRQLPQSLVSQLEQCFPNAKKIVVF